MAIRKGINMTLDWCDRDDGAGSFDAGSERWSNRQGDPRGDRKQKYGAALTPGELGAEL